MDKRIAKTGAQREKRDRYLFIGGMLFIPVLHFIFFYIYVNFSSFLMAFQRPRYDGSGLYDWGFQNFSMFFKELFGAESELLICLKNTLIFFATDVFVKLPLSLLICYFIYKKICGSKIFRAVIYLPCIIMSTVFVTLYKYMIGTGGPLFALWEAIGKEPVYFFSSSEYALKMIVFYVIYSGLGGHFILLGGAMNAIDDAIIDAGKIDGVTPFRELTSLIVPSIWPTLSTMILMASIGVFTASGPLLLFTQGEFETNTISFWIYGLTTGITGYTDYEYASAVGLVFTVLGLPVVLTVKKLIGITEER